MKQRISTIVTGLFFVFFLTAFTANSQIAIQSGIPAFTPGTHSNTPTVVGFAGFEWFVRTQSGNTLTLLAKNRDFGDAVRFNTGAAGNTAYAGGELHTAMINAYNNISNPREKALVQARDIYAKDATYTGIELVPNQYFWPLSTAEYRSLYISVRAFPFDFWLRSTGNSTGTHAADAGPADGNYAEGLVEPITGFRYVPLFISICRRYFLHPP
jgi:hypothetical protein